MRVFIAGKTSSVYSSNPVVNLPLNFVAVSSEKWSPIKSNTSSSVQESIARVLSSVLDIFPQFSEDIRPLPRTNN